MRLLLAVGCNTYENVSPLGGAERDAEQIFSCLLRAEIGDYDAVRSVLLLSPTLQRLREAIADVLFAMGPLDTFTFYFAGHGVVAAGSFYMVVRDSRPSALSVTAFSLADLFRSLNEAAPRQSNIIIDACESAGLIEDLDALVKPSLMGRAGTPQISLLATAAMDQGAMEDATGGFGTLALLKCIKGERTLHTSGPTLGLSEIAVDVAQQLAGRGQQPAVWGLNISGPPRFCKNPRFNSDPSLPLQDVVRMWPSSLESSVVGHYDDLWKQCEAAEKAWDPGAFLQVATVVYGAFEREPSLLPDFVLRWHDALVERSAKSEDRFRTAEVRAALVVSLLSHQEWHPSIVALAQQLANLTGQSLLSAGAELVDALQVDRFALLAKRSGGVFDLFQLPIRVAQCVGWMAVAIDLQTEPRATAEARVQLAKVTAHLIEHYPRAITAMCDRQAPFWAAAFGGMLSSGLTAQCRHFIEALMRSVIEVRGALARWDLDGDQAFEYVVARASGQLERVPQFVEFPSETLTVLLKASEVMRLSETLDPKLWRLDGVSCCAYLTDDFRQFGRSTMLGGSNLVWTVGDEVCRLEEFTKTWPSHAEVKPSANLRSGALLASLVLPDRVAWFVFPDGPASGPPADVVATGANAGGPQDASVPI